MNDEFKKIRKGIKVMWLILVVLLFLHSINLYLTFTSPKDAFYPSVIVKEGPKGDKGEVDSQQLAQIVEKEISKQLTETPQPNNGKDGKNGEDGSDGANGQNGKDAVVDYTEVKKIVSDEMSRLPVSQPREIEFQVNPKNENVEMRYVGDDSWQILLKSDLLWQIFLKRCSEIGMCPSQ